MKMTMKQITDLRRSAMKTRVICALLSAMVLMLLPGCGGDGGSGAGTGTVSMDITDAKPLIADDPVEFWVTIEEVLVHSSGGGWASLPLASTPLRINLLAYYGNSTELVPPTELETGHYTQIRIVISEAAMVFEQGGEPVPIDLEIPSGFLRTDKQFDFEVEDGEAAHITIDFDLSQSIKKTGDDEYKMKPVLHIMETESAATIGGEIDAGFFADGPVTITVKRDTEDKEPYTQVMVDKEDETEPTVFEIFWLVPYEEGYIVEFDADGDGTPDHTEVVPALEPGDFHDLDTIQ
jgi:hypothetical protein